MNDRNEIAIRMADHLFATERAIDEAIACAAGLAGYMPVARQQVHVSAQVGQPAIEHVVASLAMLSNARRKMVEAHQCLTASSAEARIQVRNFGGFIDKRPEAHAGLTVVAERQAS